MSLIKEQIYNKLHYSYHQTTQRYDLHQNLYSATSLAESIV